MRFAFFTKTEWDEPPRIRHQLTHLLLDRGHEVRFFQKSKIDSKKEVVIAQDGLTLCRHPHLLHHQLKFLGPLRWLDARFVEMQIRSMMRADDCDAVVNFNYDFYFLSKIFTSVPVIHIVNDDFPAAAILPNRRNVRRLQSLTAADAHHSLCVSYSILENVRKSTSNCSLFLPWARHRYRKPPESESRDEALYWGYINDRIDFSIVAAMLDSGVKINFFGHITPSRRVQQMLEHVNAAYHGVKSLDQCPEVIARCCCTILPYDTTFGMTRAVTISNRGFELLSFGLPLVYVDLPHLIEAPDSVIRRCSSADEFLVAHADATEHFDDWQKDIASFLQHHYAESRYEQFMGVVERASRK